MDNIELFSIAFDAIIKEIEDSKKVICELLVDKKFSLNYRWQFFTKYGHLFGNVESYIPDFDIEQKIGQIKWEDFNRRRGDEAVKLSLIVDLASEDWDNTILDEFCEEVLSKNLYSFKYDW